MVVYVARVTEGRRDAQHGLARCPADRLLEGADRADTFRATFLLSFPLLAFFACTEEGAWNAPSHERFLGEGGV